MEDIKNRLEQKFAKEFNLVYNDETKRWDSKGAINLSGIGLTRLPIKFGEISGHFYCNYNKLTSLKGSPNSSNAFYCDHNNLTNLEDCPQIINGARVDY